MFQAVRFRICAVQDLDINMEFRALGMLRGKRARKG